MPTFPRVSPGRWRERASRGLISALSLLVFAFLDLVDFVLCFFFRFVDGVLEGNPIPCYCWNRREKQGSPDGVGEEEEVSETLYGRRNLFREIGLVSYGGRSGEKEGKGASRSTRRWSDCGCESCISWQGKEEEKLYLMVREPSQARNHWGNSFESVIFLHGFLSSSSLWLETVFPNLSEVAKHNFRVFAVDLLGFGGSPKPTNCMYRLKEHLEMIEKSVVKPFQLSSFHLVAHSMGCIIALALAAKYPESVKSITLIAPPYFSSTEVRASHTALNRLAERKIWPPLLFGSAIMSWYEHLGRTVCFIYCRNHAMWEWILKLLTWRRDLNFMITDLTKHTHHSAWHTMHNVICGAMKLMDKHLEVVNEVGISVKIIQGDRDQVVPLECSYSMKSKLPLADLKIIANADHNTVMVGREKDFTRELEQIWFTSIESKLS
ncbi:probable lysophospholipase BODYGUARD 4 [Phoenix dactylifera]|uniref:Probable lysophospholipase BODYGUARD 4 n=1 Tax=Phoenix dactylifera TaxID=42345 RepID=A0A8B7MSM8_PHODC|nr:probable lysophospholipase BODYGUARD 4 [Phoenix dactylifera]